jgi:hypothetical protein
MVQRAVRSDGRQRQGRADSARHVTERHLTQGTRVENALSDVASNVRQALGSGDAHTHPSAGGAYLWAGAYTRSC